jgi:acyl-coenzyme A synthetase/AMP-(fatty) acid ligase
VNAAEQLLGEAVLARHGERIALLCGDEAVTYRELAQRVRASAAALRALGARRGDRIALLMRDTPECAAAWLGALHAGAVVVSVNPRLTPAECRHVVDDCGARLAIIEDGIAASQSALVSQLESSGRLVTTARWREQLRSARPSPAAEVGEEDAAFWLYSSGTTGKPKGMAFGHRSVLQAGEAFRAFGIGESDRVFTTSKLYFAYGLEHALLAPLALGLTSVLCADWPEAGPVLRIVQQHRPSVMFSVPTVYRRLLAEAARDLNAFRAMRRFVAAGERLSPQLFNQWRQATGGELLNLYGMSETFCACMVTAPGTSNGERTGQPLATAEVRLSDANDREPAHGDPGVLWVRHPAMTRGYHGVPEQTREQFRDGWFCSRDVFVRDGEGHFVHQGRSDELLKVAGQWVRPGEVEEAASLDPAVVEAACVPVLDGDGLQRLALFVTMRSDATDAARAAAAACERALPPHKRPKWVRAVAELPRTATGKVQRFKLREILERELSGKT